MSATMPPEALKMTEKFMEDPIKILSKMRNLHWKVLNNFSFQLIKKHGN